MIIRMDSRIWFPYPWISPEARDSRFTAERITRISIPRRMYRFFQVKESFPTATISRNSARKSSIRMPAVLRPETSTRFIFGRKKQVNRIGTTRGVVFRFAIRYQAQYTPSTARLTGRIFTTPKPFAPYSATRPSEGIS